MDNIVAIEKAKFLIGDLCHWETALISSMYFERSHADSFKMRLLALPEGYLRLVQHLDTHHIDVSLEPLVYLQGGLCEHIVRVHVPNVALPSN